jgi:hypothetical protein
VDPENLFGAGNHAVRGRVALSTQTGGSHS